jgi:8-oxo-dGTP diphosphatase
VLAAGGVIEQQTADGIKLAIIRRERYGTEWCLPKGKVNLGETLIQAVHREIKEETGCDIRLVRFLHADTYAAKDGIKTVFYWLCHLKGECQFTPSEEVSELVWLSPAEAIRRLTHNNQKNLIRDTFVTQIKKQHGFMQKLVSFYSRYIQAKRWKRLASAIAAYRNELPCLLRLLVGANTVCTSNLFKLLDEAECALLAGDIDKGWKYFHAARRMELLLIDDKSLLLAKAEQIRNEAEKLNKWRKAAVNNLLPSKIKPEDISPTILFDAALIRDEYYNNQAYKDSLTRAYHLILGVLLALILVWLYTAFNHNWINLDVDSKDSFQIMFTGVVTFGLFGAIYSAVIKSTDTSMSARIPEMSLAIRVTLLRIVLGAGSAVIVYALLISQLENIFTKTIADAAKDITPITIYVISFVAGFTERLVLKAVEVIGK